MGDREGMAGRKSVSLPVDLWKRIDDFRFSNRIGAEAEAIRRLLELGLLAAEKDGKRPKGKK